jgi:hypothetical protein
MVGFSKWPRFPHELKKRQMLPPQIHLAFFGSNRYVLEREGNFTHSTNQFIRKATGIDGSIVRVKDWHYRAVVLDLCCSPVRGVLAIDIVYTSLSVSVVI